jgi:hypothetical protein
MVRMSIRITLLIEEQSPALHGVIAHIIYETCNMPRELARISAEYVPLPWTPCHLRAQPTHWYDLYSCLGGVRHTTVVEPIRAPRGLPDNVHPSTHAVYKQSTNPFAESWLTLDDVDPTQNVVYWQEYPIIVQTAQTFFTSIQNLRDYSNQQNVQLRLVYWFET